MNNDAPRHDEQPAVVLVILTCNQKDMTMQCLESLFRCSYKNKRTVLVDNGSADGTIEAVTEKYPDVICLRNEKNLGAAAGRNTGIDYAQESLEFEYIMFMDNDIVVEPDFLSYLVSGLLKHNDQGISIASPKLYIMGKEKIIDCAGGAKVQFHLGSTQTRGHGEKDTGQYDTNHFPDCVPTTVLMTRHALEKAARFDTAFDPYGYEDLDFVLRASTSGQPYLFVPDSVVYHKGSKTGFTGYSKEYAIVKALNFRRFLKRHASLSQRASFYCLLPFLASKTIIRELKAGNISAIYGMVRGFLKR